MEELVLAQKITTDSIYTQKSILYNVNSIILDDHTLEYQLQVTTDTALSINTSNVSKFDSYNCEFSLDIWSDGEHAINLSNCDVQQIQVYRGMSKLHFKHYLGNAVWQVNILQMGSQIPEFVRPISSYDTPSYRNYGVATSNQASTTAVGIQVFDWSTISTPDTANSANGSWTWSATEVELYTIYPAPFILTEFRLHVGTSTSTNYPTSITVYGSNDYNQWTQVFSVNDITYTTAQEIKIYNPSIQKPYRVYKIVCAVTSGNLVIMPISIIGYKNPIIGNVNFYRYPKISATTSGYSLAINTGDGITVNKDVYYCVNTDSSYGDFTRSSSNTPFQITYTLPQAVKFEGFVSKAYSSNSSNWCNGWFKWEGSNDGTNWTRLCELRKPFGDYYVNNMWLYYMCHTQGTYTQFRITIYTVASDASNQLITGGLFPIYTLPSEYRDFDSIVPTMASDTQDGYTVSSSSTTVGATYLMYDRDNTTYGGGAISDGQWITSIDMGSSIVVKGFSLQAASNNYSKMPVTFSIQGSSDNDTWQLLQSYALGGSGWSANSQVQSFTITNTTGYRYYRMVVTATQEGGTDVRIAGLGWSTNAGQVPISYYTDEYLVPIMASDSQDGYVASAKSYYNSGHAPWHAFNRTTTGNTDVWASANSDKTDGSGNCDVWIQIQMPSAKSVNNINIVSQPGDTLKLRAPKNFKLQGSNNGDDWIDLFSTEEDTSYVSRSWSFSETAAYSYYRLYISKTFASNDNVSISQLNLTIHQQHNN